MSAIRLGVWGLGRMGFIHCEHFSAETQLYELVAGCDTDQPKVDRQIQLRYIEPGFELPEIVASPGSPPLTGGYGNEENISWCQETIMVEPAGNMWDHVEVAIVRHLYRALREGIPFPVANADALEVVRILGLVKEQNSQFKWDF